MQPSKWLRSGHLVIIYLATRKKRSRAKAYDNGQDRQQFGQQMLCQLVIKIQIALLFPSVHKMMMKLKGKCITMKQERRRRDPIRWLLESMVRGGFNTRREAKKERTNVLLWVTTIGRKEDMQEPLLHRQRKDSKNLWKVKTRSTRDWKTLLFIR